MIYSATVVLETGRKESPTKRSPVTHTDKKDYAAKTCKHIAPGGWCNKKQQRCLLWDLQFINQ